MEEQPSPSGTSTIKVPERFSCEHCKKTFAQKNGLNTHLKTHKGKLFNSSPCYRLYILVFYQFIISYNK